MNLLADRNADIFLYIGEDWKTKPVAPSGLEIYPVAYISPCLTLRFASMSYEYLKPNMFLMVGLVSMIIAERQKHGEHAVPKESGC